MHDPISDMLCRIRNALKAKSKTVEMPSSKVKVSIATVLKDEGYISGFSVNEETKPTLSVELKYYEDKPVIDVLKRISKPSRRVYNSAQSLERVNNGLGITIVTTSKGVVSDRQARQMNVGGEVICEVM